MIQSFSVRNFRSVQETVFSAAYAEGKAPNGHQTHPTWSFIQVGETKKDRVCPTLALYGANASGKTILLLALQWLIKIVRSGCFEGMYQPNLISSSDDQGATSTFCLAFWVKGDLYRYELAFNKDGICEERLFVGQKEIYGVIDASVSVVDSQLQENASPVAEQFQLRCINAKTHGQVKTFLAEITDAFPGLSRELMEAKDYLLSNVHVLKSGDVPYAVGMKALANTFDGSLEQKEREAISMMLSYLHKFDIPIVGMRLEEKSSAEGFKDLLTYSHSESASSYGLKTAHVTHSGRKVWFDIENESEGTQRLIGLLGFLLAAIRQGNSVCIDEIDDSLHSLLVIELVRLFKEKRINENKAQLIFTIHNTDLLATDLLGLSEVGIVSQRGADGSKVVRLAEIPKLRNCDEFRRRYLRGDFGGIPFVYV